MDYLINMFRSAPPPSPSSARYLQQQENWQPRKIIACGPIKIYDAQKDFIKRVLFGETIMIYAWPSRGGVIILESASVPDFNFLGLDRLNPTMRRHKMSQEEDAFSQRLLLLGAKWWDSLARYWLLNAPDDLQDTDELDASPEPTLRERYWVSVAWPSTGGLVVSEYNTNMYPGGIETDPPPDDVCRLMLCTTMDEKAAILMERFEGKLWNSVEEYDGNAFIGCWESKNSGEVGDLLQTWPETRSMDGRHPAFRHEIYQGGD